MISKCNVLHVEHKKFVCQHAATFASSFSNYSWWECHQFCNNCWCIGEIKYRIYWGHKLKRHGITKVITIQPQKNDCSRFHGTPLNYRRLDWSGGTINTDSDMLLALVLKKSYTKDHQISVISSLDCRQQVLTCIDWCNKPELVATVARQWCLYM